MPRRTGSRRSSYHVEAEITPAQQTPAPNWLSILGGVPITFILTFIVTAAIFYGVTQYRLGDYDKTFLKHEKDLAELRARSDKEVADLKNKLEQTVTAQTTKIDVESQQRTAVRNEFMANANKTTEILGQISSRLAVSETKQEATNKALDTTNQTLNKIADQLQQLNSRDRGSGR